MNRLAEYKAAERALAMQFRAFEEMKENPEIKKALEIESALDDFLSTHKLSKQALYDLLAYDVEPEKKTAVKKPPVATDKKPAPDSKKRTRRAPVVKIREFKNPHTGEQIVVGGNRDARFCKWNEDYGKDVVRSWLVAEYPRDK